MRRGIFRAFLAAAAATALTTAGLAVAGAAGASVAPRPAAAHHPARAHAALGPTIATFSYAGYEASGRDFRYIQALMRVPDTRGTSLFPQVYIQLSNGSIATGNTFTRAGIESCQVAKHVQPSLACVPGQWVGFIETFNNSIIMPYFAHFVPMNVNQGDGVVFSIYFNQVGNELDYTITPPTQQSCSPSATNLTCSFKTRAFGPTYDHAAGLADYTNAGGTPVPLPPFLNQFRLTQFRQGALTTLSGVRGSWTGPWTTSMVEATSNGLPAPQGHVRVSPSFLWSDGMVANGAVRPNDAFGVWART
jgi:hypothetical protein